MHERVFTYSGKELAEELISVLCNAFILILGEETARSEDEGSVCRLRRVQSRQN